MFTRKQRRLHAEQKAISGEGFNWVAAKQKAIQRAKARKCRRKLMHGKNGTGYASRNSYLKNMGFASYADYLKSDLWKDIKSRVFEEKGRDCLICMKPASVLHHLRYHYDDLQGKTLENIVPLCNGCHHDCEFVLGIKVSLQEAREAYLKKLEK